jgi:hypothetical protein
MLKYNSISKIVEINRNIKKKSPIRASSPPLPICPFSFSLSAPEPCEAVQAA